MTGRPTEALTPDREDRASARGDPHAPHAAVEGMLASILADVTHVERVPVRSHFFDELGADSMVMAHFCARVRKSEGLPPVSMKDIYRNPTIRSLATALSAPVPEPPGGSIEAVEPLPPVFPPPVGVPRHLLCGVLQVLAFLGYSYLVALAGVLGYEWVSAGSGAVEVYLRSVLFGLVVFVWLCGFPVLVKWVLIGRWRPSQVRVWSVRYVRFWVVKTLVRSDPLVLFVGSPLYVLYLRALGARIGPGVALFSRIVPVCTDLLTVGAGAVVRKDAYFTCYRAHRGLIQTGPVTLGADSVVGDASVLDVATAVGDRARLGHASSLHSGQTIPAGAHWHGSPAQPAPVGFTMVDPADCGTWRRALHGVLQVLAVLLVYLPLTFGGVGLLLAEAPQLASVLAPGPTALSSWTFYVEALTASVVVFFGAVPLGLLVIAVVPRLLSRTLTAGRVYRLYGFHHGVHRVITLMTNRRFLNRLFGDSSAVVHYLRWCLGYDLSRVEQTGSNFGTEVKQDSPYLSSVGSGTMIADGLSINNAEYSGSSFRVSRVAIGPRNFLGNRIAYPARGRTGDNCLLATKVMVPVDGAIREGVGLLGSPSFEIPRSVLRDSGFDELRSGADLRRLLPAKNRHNAATMAWYLGVRWLYFFLVTLLFAVAAELYDVLGAVVIALANVLVVLLGTLYFVLVERAVTALHSPGPLFCSIYDVRFWRRERYWKVPSDAYLRLYNGTPFKGPLWRLLGARIGRELFDDGCGLSERPMVTIGDHCTLNAGSVVQCHSQEDGAFKSDTTTLGSDCTVGVGALVHYGVTLGDGAALAPDSFVMKGETVPRYAYWGGNPARQIGPDDDGQQRRWE
ncbi:phosphopantetheine-binding protein [Streptomyces sp. H27-G5]|uniref:Pls/PosA family non-ribosomal peptide synthetase n=1 Tax=Streptomyces sp. H27-G5 TaxID=2996698 RepID=UPI0022709FBE|nr:Pls/PosA family non-ribosomal peptide synthetase [Streptomyces sp. H27-G5]MCY0918511.1 phosphopantetheine-binding protein [Streptomyces sp. H27-G5]